MKPHSRLLMHSQQSGTIKTVDGLSARMALWDAWAHHARTLATRADTQDYATSDCGWWPGMSGTGAHGYCESGVVSSLWLKADPGNAMIT